MGLGLLRISTRGAGVYLNLAGRAPSPTPSIPTPSVRLMLNVSILPTELWHAIFKLACVDGGFTGRSLALTSKFFHAQSLSPRFHSLAFDNLEKLEGFIAFLCTLTRGFKPRVEHLYLAVLEEPFMVIPTDFWTGTPLAERLAHGRYTAEREAKWNKRFITVATALFALTSPDLRTLTIADYSSARMPSFPCPAFPKLEELCITQQTSTLFGKLPYDRGTNPFAKFPVLRRLHYVSHYPTQIITDLSEYASPPLTHFRLSGVNADIVDEFISALDAPHRDEETALDGESHPSPANLTKLKCLVLHAFPNPAPALYHVNSTLYDRPFNRVQHIPQKSDRSESLRVLVMCRPWRTNAQWPCRLLVDWLRRMEGGEGCWVTSEEVEARLETYSRDLCGFL